MPGRYRLVRVRVDPERDAHERLLDAGLRGELRLVGGVEDDGRLLGRGLAEEARILVVAVHDELPAREPGSAREDQLARRSDVGSDALLAHEPEDGDIREGFRPVEDAAASTRSRPQRARTGAQGLLAVDDERGPEALGELRGGHPSEDELPALDPGRSRENIQHSAILPGTLDFDGATPSVGQGTAVARAAGVPLKPLGREAFLLPKTN